MSEGNLEDTLDLPLHAAQTVEKPDPSTVSDTKDLKRHETFMTLGDRGIQTNQKKIDDHMQWYSTHGHAD
ncbi:hypothetical protein FJZ28_03230 [Candidatus Peregrinibacteria bacterium]|nr:hypothetical protein [Candidatus Peregrinibacteria bacterium]